MALLGSIKGRLFRLLFGAVAALALTFVGEPVAAAPSRGDSDGNPDCPSGANYASVACLLYETAYIVETNFNQSTMYATSELVAEGNHVLQGLWAYSGVPCKSWVEQSYVYGYNFHEYYEFVLVRLDYSYPTVGSARYVAVPDGITSANGARTKFQTSYVGGTDWRVYRGESLRAQFSGGTLGSGACIAEAGLEVSKRPAFTGISSAYTAYTHTHDVFWYDSYVVYRGGWWMGVSPYKWIDYPCNQGQVPPNCLNGVWYSTSQWAANKP